MIRCAIVEENEAMLARFLGGLNREIQTILDYKEYTNITRLFHLACKAEREVQDRQALGRTGVVRRIPGRRPAPLSICIPVCASLLKANLFNLCLYSDIVASADSSMIEHLYSSPRGPWLVL